MKNFLTFLFLCFSLYVKANAQKIRFTDTTNTWDVVDVFVGDVTPEFTYLTYSSEGRSIIDSRSYIGVAGMYVREDTIAGKIYVNINDTEEILFDYNWQVGDTINYYFPSYSSYSCYVSSIDSTLINNVWHKVWNLMAYNSLYDPGSVIEGVGSISGPRYLLNPIHPENYIDLYCFSNKGATPPVSPAVLWFDNSTSCTSLSIPQVTVHSNGIQIYPNPVTTQLTITSTNQIGQITITNLLGQTVYNRTYNSQQVQIDISGFANGIYFIKVNGIDVQKFIKE